MQFGMLEILALILIVIAAGVGPVGHLRALGAPAIQR